MADLLHQILAVAGGGGRQSVEVPDQEQLMEDQPSGLVQLLGLDDYVETQWLLRLVAALVAVVLAVIVYRIIVSTIKRGARNHNLLKPVEPQLLIGVRWVFIPIALLFVLQQAGFDVGSILTMITGILAMVALGFVAVWSVASNLLAAFLIFSTKLFRIGHYVQFTNTDGGLGMTGRVRDMRLLFTELEEVRGGEEAGHGGVVRLPNNFFFQNPIRVFPQLSEEARTFMREEGKEEEEDDQDTEAQAQRDAGGGGAAAATHEQMDQEDDGPRH